MHFTPSEDNVNNLITDKLHSFSSPARRSTRKKLDTGATLWTMSLVDYPALRDIFKPLGIQCFSDGEKGYILVEPEKPEIPDDLDTLLSLHNAAKALVEEKDRHVQIYCGEIYMRLKDLSIAELESKLNKLVDSMSKMQLYQLLKHKKKQKKSNK